MTETATTDHRYTRAQLRPERSQHERDFVSDPAGGVLIDKWSVHIDPVELVTGLHHGHGQGNGLIDCHSLIEHKGKKRCCLWSSHPTIDNAVDKFTNLRLAERQSISLGFEGLVNHSVGARTLPAGDNGDTRRCTESIRAGSNHGVRIFYRADTT